MQHENNDRARAMAREAMARSPRGHRMPDTRAQFEIMGELYEKAFREELVANGKLRSKVNELQQKLENANDRIQAYESKEERIDRPAIHRRRSSYPDW
jgi:hypothetical protein